MNIRNYPLASDQVDYAELQVIITNLEHVLSKRIPGDIVEFGCYAGTTSLFLRRALNEAKSAKQLHVYDSFQGLPPKTRADESPVGIQFKAGELSSPKSTLINNFRQASLQLPIIHKAWFNELHDMDVPEQIAFAFLDGDFYESIAVSLRLVTPRLAPGAVIIIDDYQAEALPGARKAVDEWLRQHPNASCHPEKSLAVVRIP